MFGVKILMLFQASYINKSSFAENDIYKDSRARKKMSDITKFIVNVLNIIIASLMVDLTININILLDM